MSERGTLFVAYAFGDKMQHKNNTEMRRDSARHTCADKCQQSHTQTNTLDDGQKGTAIYIVVCILRMRIALSFFNKLIECARRIWIPGQMQVDTGISRKCVVSDSETDMGLFLCEFIDT